MATAIGTSIGVPLGIVVVGFLSFLFWREARRKGVQRHQQQQQTWDNMKLSNNAGSHHAGQQELSDNNIPWELDQNSGKVELRSTDSRLR